MLQQYATEVDLPPAAPRSRWRRRVPPLLLILLMQAGLSLRLIWTNTAYMDEALYLWAGRLEWAHWLHGAPLPTPSFALSFSGAPVLYSPLGALASAAGGLAGARILSLCFMLGATALLYSATKRLFDRRAAIIAAAVFAFLGVTQNLGAFATYDAMALFLLALAAWLAIRSGGRWGELALIACAATLVLADATKYACLLWNPVVVALAVLGSPGPRMSTSRARALTAPGHGIRLVVYGTAMALPLLFLVGGRSYVSGLMFTTLSRGIPGTTPPLQVLTAAFGWTGVVLALALLGFVLSLSAGDKRITWLCGVLAVAVLLAPLNQARIDTATSLQKHVAFGAWFAAIAAGYGLSRTVYLTAAKSRRLIAVTVVVVLWFGVLQTTALYTFWPNSSSMIHGLSAVLSRSKCPCLIAENNVASYYLPRQQDLSTAIGTDSFDYYDSSTRQEINDADPGDLAYKLAIRQGYFGVIEMDDAEDPFVYTAVTRTLASSHDYKLVATIPASNQKEPFRIWIRK
jgi:4-amino-4-deoxy-L-arabinose transferase-like glycosyltransferase